ncbi:MAG: hypothetical protein ACYC2Y_06695 [Armatimonadota bacterium]
MQRILRPMDYGGILDEMFALYKKNFLLFMGIVGLGVIPMQLIGQMAQRHYWLFIPYVLLLVPLNYLMTAAGTWAVSQKYLGREATIAGAYDAVRRRAWAFIGTMFVTSLIIGCGTLLCIVPGIIFGFWYAFVSQVFVLEGKDWGDARARSRELAEGQWGRIFVLGLLASLIVGVITYILVIPFQFLLMGGLQPTALPGTPQLFGMGLASGIGSALAMPIQVITFVLLYYDIRIRKEGFDIEMLAESLGEVPPAPETASGEAPA